MSIGGLHKSENSLPNMQGPSGDSLGFASLPQTPSYGTE